MEISESATGRCPESVEREIKEQASEILFLAEKLETRRQLISRLEHLEQKQKPSQLAELL